MREILIELIIKCHKKVKMFKRRRFNNVCNFVIVEKP